MTSSRTWWFVLQTKSWHVLMIVDIAPVCYKFSAKMWWGRLLKCGTFLEELRLDINGDLTPTARRGSRQRCGSRLLLVRLQGWLLGLFRGNRSSRLEQPGCAPKPGVYGNQLRGLWWDQNWLTSNGWSTKEFHLPKRISPIFWWCSARGRKPPYDVNG